MTPLNYILSLAMLVTPEPITPDPYLMPTLTAIAVEMELLDPRERRYILGSDPESDLKLLKRRYQELADAPLVHDHQRFPDRQLINDLLTFNRAYRNHLETNQEFSYDWERREILNEVDNLYKLWDTIRDTKCEYYYVVVRRQALKEVKKILGDEAYYTGNYPPHVPVWRFARID